MMRRLDRNNLKQLKEDIKINVVNKELLEKIIILLREVNKVSLNNSKSLPIHNKLIKVDNYECYSKSMDKKVIFSFQKNSKDFYIRVILPNAEENIEVYSYGKVTIVSKQKKINNTQVYVCFNKYINNKLDSITESINLDYNDPSLKKITNIKLYNNKGNKQVTLTYDKEPIIGYYYHIDYLNSNLNYNNIKDLNDKYEYSQNLVYEKEFIDCKDELNKKVLTRR